jgi:hypothetical protein
MAEWLRRLPATLLCLQSADGDSPREFESHFRRFFETFLGFKTRVKQIKNGLIFFLS